MASVQPLLPAKVRAPPAAGQEGGVVWGPFPSWEGAGKGRGARRMCGSACLPVGGAAFSALPQTAPSESTSGQGPPPGEAVRGHEAGRGTRYTTPHTHTFPAMLQDPPSLHWLDSRDPHPCLQFKLLAGFPPTSRRNNARALQMDFGDSQGGGSDKKCTAPFLLPGAPIRKLSHD